MSLTEKEFGKDRVMAVEEIIHTICYYVQQLVMAVERTTDTKDEILQLVKLYKIYSWWLVRNNCIDQVFTIFPNLTRQM
jgi:hypothetical protein